MIGFWIALASYVLWFLFKAKTVQALTLDDLALTWNVHKKQKGCTASRIHGLIKENDEVVGFFGTLLFGAFEVYPSITGNKKSR